jgi:CheY-like chemotaxis protein
VEATAGLVQAHHHLLTRDPIDDDLQVLGDFDRLSQVFTNLLSNAARYTDPGGRIWIGVRRRGDEAVIDVTDTGIGIPEGEAEHVFDLFSQVRAHQGRTGGGLGIGLAIVKSVIARHGGRVEVASAGPGKGSSFRVHLPLLAPAERGAEQAVAGLPASPHRRRVVVADDNPDAASSLAELLRMLGHEAYTAEDGEQAVEAVRRMRPDVVLLDLGMPRVDGLEAARRIRQLPYGKDVLLVALTGWGQDADRRRTAQAGFDRHLVKPVDVSQLDELIAAGSPQRAV